MAPNTLFALGAAGAVGATAYMAKRRNSEPASDQQQQSAVDTVVFMSPHAMARRRLSASKDFHETRKQMKNCRLIIIGDATTAQTLAIILTQRSHLIKNRDDGFRPRWRKTKEIKQRAFADMKSPSLFAA